VVLVVELVLVDDVEVTVVVDAGTQRQTSRLQILPGGHWATSKHPTIGGSRSGSFTKTQGSMHAHGAPGSGWPQN
jgi:hypothetical protein